MRYLLRIHILSIPLLAYCALDRYPPLDGVTVGAAVVALWVLGFAVLGSLGREGSVTAAPIVVVLMPWLAAGLFLANGILDRSPEVQHQTVAVDVHYFLASRDIVTVRSWRDVGANETFLIGTFKYPGFLTPHTPLTLGVRSGALGIAWISRFVAGRS